MGKTNGSTPAATSLDTPIESQHTDVKEEAIERGRYNRAVRGYFNVRLSNGKICFSRYF